MVLSYINRIQNQGIGKKKSFEFIQKFVEKLPSTEKIGHWIKWEEKISDEKSIPHCRCSECDREYHPYAIQSVNFCLNCGAKIIKNKEIIKY